MVKETVEPEDEDERDVHVCKKERIEGKVEPKRECSTLESSLAGMELEAPGQLGLPSRELRGALFLRAVIGIKPEKITSLAIAFQEIVGLPMGW